MRTRVVVVGGGTGTFTVLSGLKRYPLDLTAVVAMADDGGSTGVLRDELGVLPPGDIRQCLVALSQSDELMRTLMNYRFEKGGLRGHNFGNILLASLEKITGSFESAIEKAAEILRIQGRVIPATLANVALVAELGRRRIRGQHAIQNANLKGLTKIILSPTATANPKAIAALLHADLIVIGPGDFYSSIVPNLLVRSIPDAIRKSKAKKVYVANLMTKKGHTGGFTVRDFERTIARYLGGDIHYVIYNDRRPEPHLLRRYAREGEAYVKLDRELPRNRYLGADLVSRKFLAPRRGDPLKRSLIRHDPDRLAKLIVKLIPLK